MLDERITDEEDPGTFVKYHQRLRVRFRQGGKAMIKTFKPCNRGGAVSLRKRHQRRVEIRRQTELGSSAAKVDDFAADGERGEEPSTVRGLGLVRQCDQTAVDASFPICRQ